MVRIGNYEYDKNNKLGAGSFSQVYLGFYVGKNSDMIEKGTRVAIKVINTNGMSIKVKRIINDEIEIMHLIKNDPHPNIVGCFDVHETKDGVYIIMEYCDSGNLAHIIKAPIKEKYIQFYFAQLVNGLKFLYERNIVHRDIKPENILLTNNRRVLKIADFGFAKKSKDNSLYDTVCGSPLYMAPEITGQNYYNKQTDLWSVGMVLYEMLYGSHPFKGCHSRIELQNMINSKNIRIPPSETVNTDVSENCLDLLKSLLQKDVDRRITWEAFFNHNWIKIYQYIDITGKKNDQYQNQIKAMSLGSLPSRGETQDDTDTTSQGSPSVDIIQNYFERKERSRDDLDIFDIEIDDKKN